MSNIKELILQKIDSYYTEYKAKFHQNVDSYHLGIIDGLDIAERILDTLPDEPLTDCNEFEEAKEEYIRKARRTPGHEWMTRDIEDAFKAGAEWQKKQIPMPEDTVIFQKGVEEGKRLMMEGAVEGTVIELGETYKDLSLSVNAKELNQVLQPLGVGDGNKEKIIIVKEEEK